LLLSEIIFTSLASLRGNPVRTILTALAIVIGIASVIAMLSIGAGAQKALEEEIQTLGGRILWVGSGQRNRGGVKRDWVPIEIKDATALRNFEDFDWEVSAEMKERRQIQFGNANFNANVGAYWSNFFDVRDFEIEHGRSFSEKEDLARERVVVIGADVPKELKTSYRAMLNNELMINGIPYKVIGVLKSRGSQGWESPDDEVYVPLMTASARIFGSKNLRSIMVKIPNDANVEEAMLYIEGVMRVQHDIGPGQENDFRINDWFQYRDLERQATAIFTALLTGIASISLLVGGIGVMNIMLVSVTERTREIGLRKALGATNKVIMLQFIVEAVLLCVLGGIIGVLFGSLLVYIFSYFASTFGDTDWPFYIPISAILGSLGFAAAVGLFFGIWPARRAAQLDPAVSLRYE
tara:strand:+ start:480 stop:1706 length:1227 start_codon:yes stop_codon:yes gene_type:complete